MRKLISLFVKSIPLLAILSFLGYRHGLRDTSIAIGATVVICLSIAMFHNIGERILKRGN